MQDEFADLRPIVTARQASGRSDLREKGSIDLLQIDKECPDAVQALRSTNLEAHLSKTVQAISSCSSR
jgi:hypothetical protein